MYKVCCRHKVFLQLLTVQTLRRVIRFKHESIVLLLFSCNCVSVPRSRPLSQSLNRRGSRLSEQNVFIFFFLQEVFCFSFTTPQPQVNHKKMATWKQHLDMIGRNEPIQKKAKFWQSYVRALKGRIHYYYYYFYVKYLKIRIFLYGRVYTENN